MRELITLKLDPSTLNVTYIIYIQLINYIPKKRVAGATLAKPMGFPRLSR